LRTVEEFREAASANVEPTKYGTPDLTLPGGKNYREVVLTMPSTKRLDEAAARLREFESSMKDESGRSLHKHEWPEGAEAEWDRLNEQIASGKPYRGGHYGGDHPNTLAHIRLNDRTGPNGEKILFIEEIQSDWHQKGRKKGYRDGPRFTGKLSAKEMDGGIGWEITDENDNFVTNVLKTEGPGHIQFEPAGMGTLERVTVATADDALAVAQSRINNPDVGSLPVDDRVPNAPLKTSWHEMSLRRVLRMAAEEGYDSVAWTPGKVQADRYNLRKRVSEIRYAGTNLKVYGLDGETVLENTGVKHEDLPDIIGKEAADRLLAQTPDAGLRSLVGEELEIGGEGMKGFYDEMIKNYAAKFGKKFGAKVGVMDMPTKYSDNLKSDVYHVVNNNGEVIETFKRRRDADVRAEELGEGFGIKIDVDEAEEVWTIPITKRMRDSLMQEGAPLFSAAPIIPGAIAAGQQEQPAAQ